MVWLKKKYLVVLTLSIMLLTACATNEEVKFVSPGEETEEVEEFEVVMTSNILQVNEDGLAIPIEIFAEWGDMPFSEKKRLVEASLEYQTALGEMEGTPIKVEGSTEAFVEAMDLHYREVEQRADDIEKHDLMNSPIADQVGVVGYIKHLMVWE